MGLRVAICICRALSVFLTFNSKILVSFAILASSPFCSSAATGYMKLTGSDVMMLLLGVLARETASVYNFWLGSSNSSQQKDLIKK